jgi:hypothetical protein
MEILWDTEEASPYFGNLSDITKSQWESVTHIRIGFDTNTFEWVLFKGIDTGGYMIKTSPTSRADILVCPEDVWGIRFSIAEKK